jgi:hypothetical protein
MKNSKLNKIVLFCMLLATPFSAMANDIDDGNGNGDVQDIPAAAPIDDYLPLAFIAAIGMSYILLRKKSIKI